MPSVARLQADFGARPDPEAIRNMTIGAALCAAMKPAATSGGTKEYRMHQPQPG